MADMRTSRRPTVAACLAVGAVLALATSVGASHLAEACTAFVSAEGGEPAASATVAVGERAEVHGWFPTGENQQQAPPVFVRLEHEGVEQNVFPDVSRDEHDEILLVVEVEPGDEGQWRITAGMENTDCGGPAEVTVSGAADVTPTPTPAVLPDASALPTTTGWLHGPSRHWQCCHFSPSVSPYRVDAARTERASGVVMDRIAGHAHGRSRVQAGCQPIVL